MDHRRAEPHGFEAEYEAIEAAMLETARGRWFLAEFARRNRTADTDILLGAIGRLEQAVAGLPAAPAPLQPETVETRIDGDILALVARARREVAAAAAGAAVEPKQAFETVAGEAEAAAAAMLAAAAETEDLGLALRMAGAEDWLGEEVGRCADTIRAAGARQDLAARHVGRLVRVLQAIEHRLAPPDPITAALPADEDEASPADDDLFGDEPPVPAHMPDLDRLDLREPVRRLS